MVSLSTVEAKLPPGFRFHPKDEELICNYLMKWVTGCAQQTPLLIEVDLNKCEPWDIPETACVGGREWYFYSQRDRKYATGLRTNRATVSGYWKATGKDRPVMRMGTTLVGMRKTLVFYQGRAPKGRKTDWVMHEFRLEGTLGPVPKQVSSVKEDWVLCRMFYKNRSEELGKQETVNISSHDYEEITASSSSLSLPPLMEPYNNNISFHQQQIITDQATASDYNYQHHHHQQVPCFSNIYNQTAPNNFPHFSSTHNQESMVLPTKMMMPNLIGQTTFPYLGINCNLQSSLDDTNPSSCDKKVIEAVLNHLTKIESADDYHHENKFTTMKDSPASFGEGSSDSYLSEGGLMPSLWNQYQ